MVDRIRPHRERCKCESCENGLETYLAKQQEHLAKYGWTMEYVDSGQGQINAHTHGLLEKWGHPDLQIVLPMEPNLVNAVLRRLVDRIEKGEMFAPDTYVQGIVNDGMHVMIRCAQESGRMVLRVIIPDPNGHLNPKKMQAPYAKQFEGTV